MDVVGLLFDMDDVLYDDTLWRRWLFQLLGRMGLHTSYRMFFRVLEREYLEEVYQGRCEFWDGLRRYLVSIGLTAGQVDEVLAAAHAKRRQLQEGVRPLPGVLATSAKLQSLGVPMAILCNAPWPGERLLELLDRLGLSGRFHPVFCSAEVGSTKPAPQSYTTALDALRLRAAQVAYVGHSADELTGAKRIGMPTIAFNYDEDAQADIYLERFDQLLGRVKYRTRRLLAS